MRKRGSSKHSRSVRSRSVHSRVPSKSPQKSSFYTSPKRINKSPPKQKIKETFFDKIYKIYSSHSRLAELFLIHFAFLRPENGLDNLDSIPDIINFRFSFWDFKEFYTPPGVLSKPEEYKINHLLTSPELPIIKYNLIDYYTQENSQEVSIEINYDPSINNFISYKTFLSYLVFRELFIEIYDYEKQMPYGYTTFPLSVLLRNNGERVKNEKLEINIYDNFTHEIKGILGLSLKSEEINTKNNFNIMEENKRLSIIDTDIGNISDNRTNNNNEKILKKKKIVSYSSSNKIQAYRHYQNEEEINYHKNIDTIKIAIIGNQTLISKTNNKIINNNNFSDDNEKKEKKIKNKIIDFNNKNNLLTLSLIQGEPHYFNYIIHNNSEREQKLNVVISTDENKYSNNNKNDIIISLITNSEEYKYITNLKNLNIPNNYNSISENGYFILGAHKTIPLLFKCLSYKSFNGLEEQFLFINSIFIYDKNGYLINNLKIKIMKVFPIIDFEFYYKKSKEENKKINFINPLKKMTVIKSKQLLSNYIFLNGKDYKNYIPEIKIDPKTNNFYFIFNNNLDFVNNSQNNSNMDEIENKFNKAYFFQKTIDNYNNKKLLFLYKDKFRSQLLVTYKFIINSYEYINISYTLGVKMKKNISFLYSGDENKKLKFLSSDSNLIFFDDLYKIEQLVEPNKIYNIDFYIYPKKLKNYEIMINSIDMKNKEIYKSWVIKATAGKLNIIQRINIDYIISINEDIKTCFQYTNPLNTFAVINFIASTKTVIDIPINQINFNAKERRNIIINIRKILIKQNIMAYIFIMDENNFFHEIIEININYI